MAKVSYAPAVLDFLRVWGKFAVDIGLRPEFLAALREAETRLQSDPTSWGDPLRDYRGLRLTLYRHTGSVLLVFYAVHFDGTSVLVQDVALTPHSLLDDLLG